MDITAKLIKDADIFENAFAIFCDRYCADHSILNYELLHKLENLSSIILTFIKCWKRNVIEKPIGLGEIFINPEINMTMMENADPNQPKTKYVKRVYPDVPNSILKEINQIDLSNNHAIIATYKNNVYNCIACKTCINNSLSTSRNILEHCEGKKHRSNITKAGQMELLKVFNELWDFKTQVQKINKCLTFPMSMTSITCAICRVDVSTDESAMSDHFLSEKHIKNKLYENLMIDYKQWRESNVFENHDMCNLVERSTESAALNNLSDMKPNHDNDHVNESHENIETNCYNGNLYCTGIANRKNIVPDILRQKYPEQVLRHMSKSHLAHAAEQVRKAASEHSIRDNASKDGNDKIIDSKSSNDSPQTRKDVKIYFVKLDDTDGIVICIFCRAQLHIKKISEHLSGKRHKDTIKNNPDTNYSTVICSLCKVISQSKKKFKKHVISSQHQQREIKLLTSNLTEIIQKKCLSCGVWLYGDAQSIEKHKHILHPDQTSTSLSAPQINNVKMPSYTPKLGVCAIQGIDKLHPKNSLAIYPGITAENCLLCRISIIKGIANILAHIKGTRHKAELKNADKLQLLQPFRDLCNVLVKNKPNIFHGNLYLIFPESTHSIYCKACDKCLNAFDTQVVFEHFEELQHIQSPAYKVLMAAYTSQSRKKEYMEKVASQSNTANSNSKKDNISKNDKNKVQEMSLTPLPFTITDIQNSSSLESEINLTSKTIEKNCIINKVPKDNSENNLMGHNTSYNTTIDISENGAMSDTENSAQSTEISLKYDTTKEQKRYGILESHNDINTTKVVTENSVEIIGSIMKYDTTNNERIYDGILEKSFEVDNGSGNGILQSNAETRLLEIEQGNPREIDSEHSNVNSINESVEQQLTSDCKDLRERITKRAKELDGFVKSREIISNNLDNATNLNELPEPTNIAFGDIDDWMLWSKVKDCDLYNKLFFTYDGSACVCNLCCEVVDIVQNDSVICEHIENPKHRTYLESVVISHGFYCHPCNMIVCDELFYRLHKNCAWHKERLKSFSEIKNGEVTFKEVICHECGVLIFGDGSALPAHVHATYTRTGSVRGTEIFCLGCNNTFTFRRKFDVVHMSMPRKAIGDIFFEDILRESIQDFDIIFEFAGADYYAKGTLVVEMHCEKPGIGEDEYSQYHIGFEVDYNSHTDIESVYADVMKNTSKLNSIMITTVIDDTPILKKLSSDLKKAKKKKKSKRSQKEIVKETIQSDAECFSISENDSVLMPDLVVSTEQEQLYKALIINDDHSEKLEAPSTSKADIKSENNEIGSGYLQNSVHYVPPTHTQASCLKSGLDDCLSKIHMEDAHDCENEISAMSVRTQDSMNREIFDTNSGAMRNKSIGVLKDELSIINQSDVLLKIPDKPGPLKNDVSDFESIWIDIEPSYIMSKPLILSSQNSDRYECRLCLVSLQNCHNIIEHVVGRNHQANIDEYFPIAYYCNLCDLHMATMKVFNEHKKSNSHNEKVALAKNECEAFAVAEYACSTCRLTIIGDKADKHEHIAFNLSYLPASPKRQKENRSIIKQRTLLKVSMMLEDERKLCNLSLKLLSVALRIMKHNTNDLETCRALEEHLSKMFPGCKAFPFGSRVSGLANLNSDLDVFLDLGGMYEGSILQDSLSQERFVKECFAILSSTNQWAEMHPITTARTPILRAYNKTHCVDCDISFRHGLSVENTNLLRTLLLDQPIGRRLILVIKEWVQVSHLRCFGGYALSFMTIFYLQMKQLLPPVWKMMHNESESKKIICGWECQINKFMPSPKTTKKLVSLLRDFFKFFGNNFDYEKHVICPLMGQAVPKSAFEKPETLPLELEQYRKHYSSISPDERDDPNLRINKWVMNHPAKELFRHESAMCVQDPFDLSHNLTKAITPKELLRFKLCCQHAAKVVGSKKDSNFVDDFDDSRDYYKLF